MILLSIKLMFDFEFVDILPVHEADHHEIAEHYKRLSYYSRIPYTFDAKLELKAQEINRPR